MLFFWQPNGGMQCVIVPLTFILAIYYIETCPTLLRKEKKKSKNGSNLQDILLVWVQDEGEGLVPGWIDVVVYVFGPFPALWSCWDEQFHVRVRGVHCRHIAELDGIFLVDISYVSGKGNECKLHNQERAM